MKITVQLTEDQIEYLLDVINIDDPVVNSLGDILYDKLSEAYKKAIQDYV